MVPVPVPLFLNVMPFGRVPDSVIAGAGTPDVVPLLR
jgi:hypothetical protein